MSDALGKQLLLRLKNSLTSRFMRFLLTAVPTFLLVVIPRRVHPTLLGHTKILKCSVWYLLPHCAAFLKFDDLSTLSSFRRQYLFMENV